VDGRETRRIPLAALEPAVQAFDRLWIRVARPKHLVSSGPSTAAKIALSFDDGPSVANTAAVMDLLEQHGARGTFFVVGSRTPGHEDLLRRAISNGHELGNHTFSHVHTVRLPLHVLEREIVSAQRAIENAVGAAAPLRLVRPPFGKDRRRITNVTKELGLVTVLWSIDSGDTRGFESQRVVEAVTANAKPGAIVLMHDGGQRRDTTLTALSSILPHLRARGFELTTVSDVLGLADS
jgi:peptidoglycan-N-acetylglucosamine deacetylase